MMIDSMLALLVLGGLALWGIREHLCVRSLFRQTPHLIHQEVKFPGTGIADISQIQDGASQFLLAVKVYANRPDTTTQRAREVIIEGKDKMVAGCCHGDDSIEYGICENNGDLVRFMQAPLHKVDKI